MSTFSSSSTESASFPSTSSVAGQQSLSLVTRCKRRNTDLLLPLSPFPSYSWDMKDLENDQNIACMYSPLTPSLSWSSGPSTSSDYSEDQLKSIFEDWDDPLPTANIINEEDGSQTLVITADSPFYDPPSAAKPFGYAPFSAAFPNSSRRESIAANEMPMSAVSPSFDDRAVLQPPPQAGGMSTKRQLLFIDTNTATASTTTSTETCFTLSASVIFSALSMDETPLWSLGGFTPGLDLPSDLDSSVSERWEEKMWYPIMFSPVLTASCG